MSAGSSASRVKGNATLEVLLGQGLLTIIAKSTKSYRKVNRLLVLCSGGIVSNMKIIPLYNFLREIKEFFIEK